MYFIFYCAAARIELQPWNKWNSMPYEIWLFSIDPSDHFKRVCWSINMNNSSVATCKEGSFGFRRVAFKETFTQFAVSCDVTTPLARYTAHWLCDLTSIQNMQLSNWVLLCWRVLHKVWTGWIYTAIWIFMRWFWF